MSPSRLSRSNRGSSAPRRSRKADAGDFSFYVSGKQSDWNLHLGISIPLIAPMFFVPATVFPVPAAVVFAFLQALVGPMSGLEAVGAALAAVLGPHPS